MTRLLKLFSILLLSVLSYASNTTVTATITGTDAQVWANGTYSISFWPTPGKPLSDFNVNGAAFPQGPFTGTLDGTGTFSLVLTDNLSIAPSGSKWSFTICPNASRGCFTTQVSVTGGSQSLSTTLNAAASAISVPAAFYPRAYLESQVTTPAGNGSTFFNTLTNSPEWWTGSVWTSLIASSSMPRRIGMVNVITDCGAVGDGVTDDFTAIQTCITNNPSKTILFPQTKGVPTSVNLFSYYSSGTLTMNNGNGQHLIGSSPANWFAPVDILFAHNTTGIDMSGCNGCSVENLGLTGQDAWSQSNLTTYPDWTPAQLVDGTSSDGLRIAGGNAIIRNVTVESFSGNCIYGVGGYIPGASDFTRIENVTTSGCRGNGTLLSNSDANAYTIIGLKSYSNMLAGAYDFGQAASLWLGFGSHGDAQSNVSAGITQAVTSINIATNVATLVTTAALANGVQNNGTWVAISSCTDATYDIAAAKVLSVNTGTKTITYNFTHADGAGGTNCVVGTAASADITTWLQAKSNVSAPNIKRACFAARDGAVLGATFIHPYCESTSAPPNVSESTIVLGGEAAQAPSDFTPYSKGSWLFSANNILELKTSYIRQEHYTAGNTGFSINGGDAGGTHAKTMFTVGKMTGGNQTDLWSFGLLNGSSDDFSIINEAVPTRAPFHVAASDGTISLNTPDAIVTGTEAVSFNSAATSNSTGDVCNKHGNASSATWSCLMGDGNLKGAGLSGTVANPSANHAVCWKTTTTLGYCSTVIAADGTCTCN